MFHHIFSRNKHLNELIGSSGYSAPSMDTEWLTIKDESDLNLATAHGISVQGNYRTNPIYYKPGSSKYNLVIDLGEAHNNCVILDESAYANGLITIRSTEGVVILCAAEYGKIDIFLDKNAPAFYVGKGSYLGEVTAWVQGDQALLAIGEDCMTGWAVGIRTSDFHAVFDIDAHEILNKPENTIIGPHVWLSHDVIVMKGRRIGAGSIVGARSLVSKDVPPRSLAVGSPAKVVRSNVTWSRNGYATKAEMAEICARDYLQD